MNVNDAFLYKPTEGSLLSNWVIIGAKGGALVCSL
jgi:hypothetical protein